MLSLLTVFAFSLIFLITSANFLLRFIEKFSGKIKISPLIVGATIIAIGTSLPETSVAFSSITQNAIDISFGDVIGSNIVNICLVIGLGIFLFPVRFGTQKTQRNNFVMLFATAYFIALFLIPLQLRKGFAVLSIFAYIIFILVETIWGEIGSKKEDKKALLKLSSKGGSPLMYLMGIGASLAGLLISSHFFVSSIISFSQIFGLNKEIIGLSIVAIGTSLPELATTVASGFNKDWKLLYGNIQGSNIYNLLIIGSILFISSKNGVKAPMFPIMVLGFSTLSIIYLSHKFEGKTIPRIFGLAYIGLYAFYIWRIYNPSMIGI